MQRTRCGLQTCFVSAIGPTTDSQGSELIKENVQEVLKKKLDILPKVAPVPTMTTVLSGSSVRTWKNLPGLVVS